VRGLLDDPFFVEWMLGCGVILLITLDQRLFQAVVFLGCLAFLYYFFFLLPR
jgi:hypothetical protein